MQEFEELLRAKLEKILFTIPNENLVNLLPIWEKLLTVNSLQKLECDPKSYDSMLNEVLSGGKTFNLFNVSLLLNAITRTSAKELDIQHFQLSKALFYNMELVKSWNEIVSPIQKKLQNDFKARLVLEAKQNESKQKLHIPKMVK